MIAKDKDIDKYLTDWANGKIQDGLKIDCDLDDYLRFKPGTFNIILGHDNVGKTYWRCWYYLVLAVKYHLKFCIWTGENKAGEIYIELIQMYSGRPAKGMTAGDLINYRQQIGQYFTFIDNSKYYKFNELLDIFSNDNYAACLIDPYTGLERNYGHSDNYEFLNATRHWVNNSGVSIDVCTHPVSSSGRKGSQYPENHPWAGQLREPYKAEVEGGKPFLNRCDDMYTIHRIPKLDLMKYTTLVYVEKIKNVRTGGEVTPVDDPVYCEFNSGLGFKVGGVDPLRGKRIEPVEGYEAKPIPKNEDFEAEVKARNAAQDEIDEKFVNAEDDDKLPF